MRTFRIPITRFQGTSGRALKVSGARCRAASPIVSNRRITASWVRKSERNCSRDMPARCWRTIRADSRMSARSALSLDIKRMGIRQDGGSAVGIAAALNGAAADKVHPAPKDPLQTALQTHPLQQAAALVFLRG